MKLFNVLQDTTFSGFRNLTIVNHKPKTFNVDFSKVKFIHEPDHFFKKPNKKFQKLSNPFYQLSNFTIAFDTGVNWLENSTRLLVSGRSPECSDCLLGFYGAVIT